jgi:hypothetical protein
VLFDILRSDLAQRATTASGGGSQIGSICQPLAG